jgi:hypothetical protein
MSIRGLIVRATVATLLIGAGWICWSVGELQARLADANGQIVLLQYRDSLAKYEDIEQSVGVVARIPARVVSGFGDVRERRAAALYWDKQYGELSVQRDTAGQLVETNADILFMEANAAFRAGNRPGLDSLAVARTLDEAVANYADVLKRAPGHPDAAYNYEYAVRVRESVSRSLEAARTGRAVQKGATGQGRTAVQPAATAHQYDLPAGPTVHGHPGASPEASDNTKFKMLVPMQPDERQGTPDRAGEGRRPLRRG